MQKKIKVKNRPIDQVNDELELRDRLANLDASWYAESNRTTRSRKMKLGNAKYNPKEDK